MQLGFLPMFVINKTCRIFAFDYFKNVIKVNKHFKGSQWEQKMQENPDIYVFFRERIKSYLEEHQGALWFHLTESSITLYFSTHADSVLYENESEELYPPDSHIVTSSSLFLTTLMCRTLPYDTRQLLFEWTQSQLPLLPPFCVSLIRCEWSNLQIIRDKLGNFCILELLSIFSMVCQKLCFPHS